VIRVHVSSGCPAKYYGYISSYCSTEKIWNIIFAKDPMNKEVAMRYGRIALEKGGTQNHLEMLENLFLVRLSGENLCE
jgi:Zn-dependent oligopeptidase